MERLKPMIELTQDQLGQCVTYFVQGSPMQIIGGVLTVIVCLIPFLTKWNVPDAMKGLFAPMLKKSAEPTVEKKFVNVIEVKPAGDEDAKNS